MRIQTLKQNPLSLENFEGPLAFLFHLVQKKELAIEEIPIFSITNQYLDRGHHDVSEGGEFIDFTSSLIWLKSKWMLPKELDADELGLEEGESPFEIFPKLVEYCRFREVAKELTHRQEEQKHFWGRGCTEPPPRIENKRLGVEHLQWGDLARIFEEVLEKCPPKRDPIQEETWRVCDKIKEIRSYVKKNKEVLLSTFLSPERSRPELIVTFLALLELMKAESLTLYLDETSNKVKVSYDFD